MTSLQRCLEEARTYWDGSKPGTPESVQSVRARVCCEILGLKAGARSLSPLDATKLLRKLADRGLARKTVADYYSTFKRMLALSDQIPAKGYARWPKPLSPARKIRKPITVGAYAAMVKALGDRNFPETADLAVLLNAIGGRVQREVLLQGNLKYRTLGGVLVVFITGKGGHEREVPIACKAAGAIIRDKKRYGAILEIPYKTHLWRWNTVLEEIGLKGLATFHNIRHKYATEALGKTKNLRLVQELLGHSNPATTAIYTHVSMDDKVKALTE